MSPYELCVVLAFAFRSWYKTFVQSESTPISVRVQEARKGANLSRAQLAEQIGSSEAAVRLWEQGLRVPRLKYLSGIAKATGREVAWFFEGVAA